MDKLECPRCKNEGLKGTENYCPICGLALKNNKENLEKENDVLLVEEYFKEAFMKMYEENKKEDINLEQYTANISVMLEIAKALDDSFALNQVFI